MKAVAIYSYVPKLHSLYREIINNPPEGYTYLVDKTQLAGTSVLAKPQVSKTAFNFGRMIDTVRIKDQLFRHKRFPPHDLLYSTGYLCLRKEPWVVDMEFPSTFTGYSLERFERRRRSIEKVLASPYCKQIIPWTDAASGVMRNAFPSLHEKITTVPLVVSKKNVQHVDRKDDKFMILFVGSANLPDDFFIKGGPDMLEAYEQLCKRYEYLELYMRCSTPATYKQRYGHLPGLHFVEQVLPFSDLERLYTQSDVFIGIAHHTPGVANLEAMSYGLPVIATDLWENPKIVNKNIGLLIPKHSKGTYYLKYGMPNWGTPSFMKEIAQLDPARVQGLVDAVTTLIENASLRKRMGMAARAQVETGQYSVAAKNRILKKVYDEAT